MKLGSRIMDGIFSYLIFKMIIGLLNFNFTINKILL